MTVPRQRTVNDVDRDLDRDLDRIRWVREQAIDRLDANAAEIATNRLNQLLDERWQVSR